MTTERWKEFWRFYKDQPHQQKAIEALYQTILKADSSILSESAQWRQIYSQTQTLPKSNPLKVPYQTQNDNVSGKGYRECFDSTCAMAAMFYGKVKNDAEYSKIRSRFGDTTESKAQVQTLQSMGLRASFAMTGTSKELERLIDAGQPVPVGWLHHGPASAPRGGGHWSLIIGYTPTHWILHDPYGEADLVQGGYVNHSKGQSIQYSRKNWEPRWRVNGTGGWFIDVKP